MVVGQIKEVERERDAMLEVSADEASEPASARLLQLRGIDWATLQAADDTLILDIARDEVERDEDWDDGSGWLAALAPLRADLLAGDVRLFYLLWLRAIEGDGLARR